MSRPRTARERFAIRGLAAGQAVRPPSVWRILPLEKTGRRQRRPALGVSEETAFSGAATGGMGGKLTMFTVGRLPLRAQDR